MYAIVSDLSDIMFVRLSSAFQKAGIVHSWSEVIYTVK